MYYTPDIFEFHTGFDYEYCEPECDGEVNGKVIWIENWNKETFYLESVDYDFLNRYEFRVKYLDREDIESLGWVYDKNSNIYTKGSFKLMYNIKIRIWTETSNVGFSDTLFEGVLKNKSELKTILRQLKIK